ILSWRFCHAAGYAVHCSLSWYGVRLRFYSIRRGHHGDVPVHRCRHGTSLRPVMRATGLAPVSPQTRCLDDIHETTDGVPSFGDAVVPSLRHRSPTRPRRPDLDVFVSVVG